MKMATGESSDEDDKIEELDGKIGELRSAKKELFEKMRPMNDEMDKIVQHERECVDERHRLTVKKHNRERQQPSVQRVAELEFELRQAKWENEKLSEMNKEMQETLDKAAKQSKAQTDKIAELEKLAGGKTADVPAQIRSTTRDNVAVIELQQQLQQTNELLVKTRAQFHETRQRLSDVQERLTVAEQVTAATQQRALQESDISKELLLQLTPQHQPTTRTGFS